MRVTLGSVNPEGNRIFGAVSQKLCLQTEENELERRISTIIILLFTFEKKGLDKT
jgi:hypothetical protein